MHHRAPSTQQAQQQQPQTPGVSIKKLLKNSKAAPSTAVADSATQHACYVATIKGHTDAIVALAFDREASALATACEDRVIRLFKCAQLAAPGGASFRRLPLTANPGGLAFGSTAQQLLVLTNGVSLHRLWQLHMTMHTFL